MAEIVLGLGTSHGPQVTTPPDKWLEDASRYEKFGLDLHSIPDGKLVTFAELVARKDQRVAAELTMEKFTARAKEVADGVALVEKAIVETDPDVIVMFGDDQHELFLDNQIPVFGIYCGETYPIVRPVRAKGLNNWNPGNAYVWEGERQFDGHPDLAKHIVRSVCADDFDVMQSSEIAEGESMSHAFSFVHKTILKGRPIRTIPIWVNTYFPPNQPSPKRCVNFGRAVRRAIESWPGKERVAILGSGGLSHFTVDEELDRRIIAAFRSKKYEDLYTLPEHRMQSGTSECKNWIAAAGALEHLDLTDIRYIPGYRTPAGTGVGMAFARWG